MKIATYTLFSGETKEFSYDETELCIICNLPVIEASVGGTVICSWCDCGKHRNGEQWKSIHREKIQREAKAIEERKTNTFNLIQHINT